MAEQPPLSSSKRSPSRKPAAWAEDPKLEYAYPKPAVISSLKDTW
jgi:hypothetical protein